MNQPIMYLCIYLINLPIESTIESYNERRVTLVQNLELSNNLVPNSGFNFKVNQL